MNAPAFLKTVAEFNAAVDGSKAFNPAVTNGRATSGQPPFVAYQATCGITLTYSGLAIDEAARAQNEEGEAIVPSNLPTRHQLAQHGVDAGLPARPTAAQMLHGFGVQPDFHLDLWRIQLGASAPGGLHSGHEGRVQRRIIVVNLGIKLVHNNTSFHAFPPGAG